MIGTKPLQVQPGDIAEKARRWIAIGAVSFGVLRLAGTTASFAIYDRDIGRELAAINAIPQDASMVALVGNGSETGWSIPRTGHLPSLALARKQAFANDHLSCPASRHCA